MSFESFSVIDENNNITYLGDLGLYIGKTDNDLWSEVFIPDTEHYIDSVTHMDGQLYLGSKLKPRNIEIPVFAMEVSEVKRRELQKILFAKKPMKIMFDRRPFQFITVVSNGEVNMDYIYDGTYYNTLQTLRYIAYDPLFYSFYKSTNVPKRGNATDNLEEMFMYDAGIEYLENYTPSVIEGVMEEYNFQLYNGGNYITKSIITIAGVGKNIEIVNYTTNQSFKLFELNDEIIVVDGLRGIVREGGSPTRLKTSIFDGDFIEIADGYNDMFIRGENLDLGNVKFEYRYAYI